MALNFCYRNYWIYAIEFNAVDIEIINLFIVSGYCLEIQRFHCRKIAVFYNINNKLLL